MSEQNDNKNNNCIIDLVPIMQLLAKGVVVLFLLTVWCSSNPGEYPQLERFLIEITRPFR